MKSSKMQYIIIVGCGRLGSYLANTLSGQVIDIKASTFESLSSEFSGFRVEGDATEYALLKQVKTDKANILIAATREDNVNLMVVQVAKNLFGVQRVMARVFDPRREEIYRDFGIETISPTSIAAAAFLNSLKGSGHPNPESPSK